VNPDLTKIVLDLSLKRARKSSFFYRSCKSAAQLWDVPFFDDEPRRTEAEISDLFRKTFESKTYSTWDDVWALLPAPSRPEIGHGVTGLGDLAAALRDIVDRLGGTGPLGGSEAERKQAKRMLDALYGVIEPAPDKG
jgi:hypothetical protein